MSPITAQGEGAIYFAIRSRAPYPPGQYFASWRKPRWAAQESPARA